MTDDMHAQLAAREAKVAEAEHAQREVEAQHRQAAARLEELGDQLAALSVSSPNQFDDTGNPKPKTPAGRLAAEIGSLKDPAIPWRRRLEESHKVARWARIELDNFIGRNVAALADDSKGRQAGDDLRAQANALIEAIDNYHGAVAYYSALVSKASGLEPQVELPGALPDRLSNFRRELQKLVPDIRDPLPRSIFPAPGETPPRVLTEGGWVGVQHTRVEEERAAKREQQAERERNTRRNVRIRQPQPQPVGRSPLEETLDALLGDQ